MSDLLRKVQLTQYDILKELDRISKEHGIKYYIAQGTLLGAVKYKKFIPWDDDIDLLIPYRELKKLEKIFPLAANEKYKLTNCYVEKHFPVPWSKIRNTATLSRPERYKDMPISWGICIDLFPIYAVSNIAFIRKIEYIAYKIASKMIMAEFTRYEEGHGFVVRLIEKIPLCVRHTFLKAVQSILSLHSDKTKYVMIACKGVKIIGRDMFFCGENTVEFEGGTFPTVNNFHEYLTLNYGDYMADLPTELRKGHDLTMGNIEWSLQED